MSKLRRILLGSALATAAFAFAADSASADDRALLRTGSGDPYVMLLFDTSGSMNWSPRCTAEQVATGICSYLCPDGDCAVPRDGDDPASKFRQAKEALYEVLRSVDNIHFGFATYNQDNLRIQFKSWLYRLRGGASVTLAGGTVFPQVGAEEVFGATFACDSGTGDAEIGCYANGDDAADTSNLWEISKTRRLSKLGDDLSAVTSYYIRSGGQVYFVQTSNPTTGTQTLGDPTMRLRHRVFRCTGSPSDNPTNGCNASGERSLVTDGDFVVDYDLVGDFVKWDNGPDRTGSGGFDNADWSSAGGTCNGWDPNDDTIAADRYNGYSLRFPAMGMTYDPPGTANDAKFTIGDVVPLDWQIDNKDEILDRFAPRLNGGDPTTDPEAFAVATYLNDHRLAGQDYVRLRNESLRPLFPAGSTPLGYSLKSIREWFRGCENGSCPGFTGWDDIASAQDPDWQCRRKYLIVITDGDDTCPGRDPCSLTASMNSLDDITTYVVAFGVENTSGNRLNCMAANGGSGDPIYPQNRQELIDALTLILGSIQEEAVAFASAAVPTVQADIADKIYLSSFTPLNASSVWPGRIDAFLKPLPTDDAGLPDRVLRICALGTVEGNCYAWDAGDSQAGWDTDGVPAYQPRGLLVQAPLESEITLLDNLTLRVGNGADQRRVFFGVPASTTLVGKRQPFRFPETVAEQAEYEFIWNLPPPLGSTANRDVIADVVAFTLREKQAEITDPDTGDVTRIQYVMGDIFHSNPLVVNPPGDFEFFTQDLYWNTPLCGQTLAQTQARGNEISYAWFANKHLCRRVMVLAGSNDGQLHAFDGGIFNQPDGVLECKLDLPASLRARDPQLADDTPVTGEYDFGSGREIFSFIPAAQMPLVKELSEVSALTTQYGIDGSPRVSDVFIDPVLDINGDPSCVQRQWRTVTLTNYREGGPGFFALDITQPDVIDTATNVPEALPGSPEYVPSCIDGGAGCGPTPFPTLLWEFSDTSDEDGVGGPDLAESWSRPVVTRIKVCEGACDTPAEPEDRFVAIFGGGLPESPLNSDFDDTGNWVYMIDVETGQILYKRGGEGVIAGAVAADVSVVDANVNGIPDVFYFGTTAGFVYKLPLGEGPFELDAVTGRIEDPVAQAGLFDPFQIFSTGGRPIQLEISAVFVPKLRANALLFGTGNRWDLWEFDGTTGRFYAIVDIGFQDGDLDGMIDAVGCASCTQPLTEASIELIDPDAAFDLATPGPSFLIANPDATKLPGWFFPLGSDEKLITEPFSLSGVTFFTIFDPISSEAEDICARGGESKIFTVNTANALGYAVDPVTGDRTRYTTAPQFTTQPYTEQSATANEGAANADPWTEELAQINADLKKLSPPGCRFANFTTDIKTIRSDTGIVFIAPVPICIEPHNWKEY